MLLSYNSVANILCLQICFDMTNLQVKYPAAPNWAQSSVGVIAEYKLGSWSSGIKVQGDYFG